MLSNMSEDIHAEEQLEEMYPELGTKADEFSFADLSTDFESSDGYCRY